MIWRCACVLLCAMMAAVAAAHPLGNATVNRQAGITVSAQEVELRYVLDLAEIPSLVASQEADTDQDGQTSGTEWAAHAQRWARQTLTHLDLRLDGQPLPLRMAGRHWSIGQGAAGLQTLRLEAHYRAPLSDHAARGVVEFHDASALPELGWKEIFLRAGKDVKRLSADVPAHDRSKGLTVFPAALMAAYPEEIRARAELEWLPVAAPAAAPVPATPAPDTFAPSAIPVSASPSLAAVPSTPQATGWPQARAMFALGVYHIATGWDHLAFLCGLLLLGMTTPRLIKIITAFTIAHSTTLALASLAWIVPPGAWIEPAIALSVAYVGLANLLWRKNGHGIFLAFIFGLVHGFGFAGALAETLGRDQSSAHWLLSLASFNLGIEAFQIAMIALAVPLLRWAARFPWAVYARNGAGLSIFGLGMGWFALRVALN